MAIQIRFDSNNNPIQPTLVLAARSGERFGVIPAHNIVTSENMNYPEIRFSVSKYDNGNIIPLWDEIRDLRLVWCVEWDVWFEIQLETKEDGATVKNITAKSVGVSELSQTNLYGVEINTEDDIARDDYAPTVLFNENNPEASLLHRIMEKVPHYTIAHVDSTIAGIQRVFTFDNKSIFDAFNDIETEIGCVFVIDSGSDSSGGIARTVSVYDLESYCEECGYRGSFTGNCPKCGSANITEGFGNDTTIFVTADNLANEITYKTNIDSVKNCFRVEGGDDLMTATFINCNPNGSGYIWYLTDELKQDMSDALRTKITEYDAVYTQAQSTDETMLDAGAVTAYNTLIAKYRTYDANLEEIDNPIVGYPALMRVYYDVIDFGLYLKNELMPSVDTSGTTAAQEAAKLTQAALSPTAVTNLMSCSTSTASSAVLAVAKTIVRSDYQVKVETGSYASGVWTGSFTVTNYSDDDDTATSDSVSVTITDDQETYYQQRIDKTLKNKSDDTTDIVALFNLELTYFRSEIRKYCLERLNAFHDACQACMDILIEQGVGNSETWASEENDLYTNLYLPIYYKLEALEGEIQTRESEIAIVDAAYDENGGILTDGLLSLIVKAVTDIQNELNIANYLGTALWTEFVSFRREGLYKNSNYISDGLDNAELFDRALELLETASNEIYKSANLQHQITAQFKNLLVMNEFRPLVNQFAIGNWLRLRVDDRIYKLRLVSYEVNFENLSDISVTFSDVTRTKDGLSDLQSILSKASAMATSYDSVKHQASGGNDSRKTIANWVASGLNLTQVKIIDSAQNQELVVTDHGIICREYLPLTDTYDSEQLKIINKGIYLTDDGWLTSRAGIGKFIYYDPGDNTEKEAYGVIADTLVGNLILSNKVGIYNEGSSIVLDEDGFKLVTTQNYDSKTFQIQRKTIDSGGTETIENVIWLDNNGNANFKGNITATSLTIQDSSGGTTTNVPINNYVQDIVDDTVGYRLEIISTSDILSEDIQTTTLSARVWHGKNNVTDDLSALLFRWTRVSSDSAADAIWNNNHTGMKSITLTTQDVLYSATYQCELEDASS